MAKKGVMIKDAPLVEFLVGDEKIPISDGSDEAKAVDINTILAHLVPSDFNDDFNNDFTN
jgi:hypothetical protein